MVILKICGAGFQPAADFQSASALLSRRDFLSRPPEFSKPKKRSALERTTPVRSTTAILDRNYGQAGWDRFFRLQVRPAPCHQPTSEFLLMGDAWLYTGEAAESRLFMRRQKTDGAARHFGNPPCSPNRLVMRSSSSRNTFWMSPNLVVGSLLYPIRRWW